MIVGGDSARFLLTVVLVLFAIAPLFGGLFLKLAFRLLKIEGLTFLRCWMAYAAAYVAASISGTLLILLIPDARSIPAWLAIVVFLLALAVHVALVPLVLRRRTRECVAGLALGMGMYAVALAVVLTPVTLHARKQGRRIAFIADMKGVSTVLVEYSMHHGGRWPSTLEDVEDARHMLGSSSAFGPDGPTYLGEYIASNSVPEGESFAARGISARLGWEDPVLWGRTKDFPHDDIVVFFADNHYQVLPKSELEKGLRATVERLGPNLTGPR